MSVFNPERIPFDKDSVVFNPKALRLQFLLSGIYGDDTKYIRNLDLLFDMNADAANKIANRIANDDRPKLKSIFSRVVSQNFEEAQLILAQSTSGVRVYLAMNPNVIPYILDYLSNDKNESVIWAVAKNRSLPVELQRKLLEKTDIERAEVLRTDLAGNPAIDITLQIKLLDDESELVRSGLARSTRSLQIQEALAKDQSPDVRRNLCSNRELYPSVLIRLKSDRHPDVAAAAQEKSLNGHIHESRFVSSGFDNFIIIKPD